MELSEIVYSILVIVFSLITVILIFSYLGYRMKRREESVQNTPTIRYQDFRTGTSGLAERKWQ